MSLPQEGGAVGAFSLKRELLVLWTFLWYEHKGITLGNHNKQIFAAPHHFAALSPNVSKGRDKSSPPLQSNLLVRFSLFLLNFNTTSSNLFTKQCLPLYLNT